MGMTLQIKGSLNYAFSSDSRGDSIWDKASRLTLQCGSGTKDIFKTFFQRNFCRGKKALPNNNKSKTTENLGHIFKCTYYSNKEKREVKKGEREFLRALVGWWLYPSFNDRILIYVEIPVSRTRVIFPKLLLHWKCSLLSRLIAPIHSVTLATLKYSGHPHSLYLLRQIWEKNLLVPLFACSSVTCNFLPSFNRV